MIGGALLMIVGTQVVALGLCAHAYGTYFMGERDPWFDRMRARFRLEHGLLLGGAVHAGRRRHRRRDRRAIWIDRGFGALSEERLAVLAAALLDRRHPDLLLARSCSRSSGCAGARQCRRPALWDDIAAIAGVPLVMWALAFGQGLLIERAAKVRLPNPLLPVLGFCSSMIVSLAVFHTHAGNWLAIPVVVGLALAGVVLQRRGLRARLNAGWPLLAAVVVYVGFNAAVILSGHWVISGYNIENDSAYELLLVHHLQAHGTAAASAVPSTANSVIASYLTTGYPLGSQSLLAVIAGILGVSPAVAWQSFISAMAAVGALAASQLSGRTMRPWLGAAAGALALGAALTYEYALQGAIKEIAVLAAILCSLAVIRYAILSLRGRLTALALCAIPLAAVLAAYNAAGVPYVLALAGSGAVAAMIVHRRLPGRSGSPGAHRPRRAPDRLDPGAGDDQSLLPHGLQRLHGRLRGDRALAGAAVPQTARERDQRRVAARRLPAAGAAWHGRDADRVRDRGDPRAAAPRRAEDGARAGARPADGARHGRARAADRLPQTHPVCPGEAARDREPDRGAVRAPIARRAEGLGLERPGRRRRPRAGRGDRRLRRDRLPRIPGLLARAHDRARTDRPRDGREGDGAGQRVRAVRQVLRACPRN